MDMNAGLRKILPESEKNFQKMLRNFRFKEKISQICTDS